VDIHIRKEGRSGRITLHRPRALNALTYQMCLDIESALDAWRDDEAVNLVVIDAAGEKAFCAGGDIQDLYTASVAGNFSFGQTFWRDEYRLNEKIYNYPKPYIALMQGFVMGGGVGVSCHGSHRIVCETSKIAMPECGIGLVPDVGGSLILARAPGKLGEYLGTTGARMDAGNAIYAGFADTFVASDKWETLLAQLITTGSPTCIKEFASPAPIATFKDLQSAIDVCFETKDLLAIRAALINANTEFSIKAAKQIDQKSPLSVAATPTLIARVRAKNSIEAALSLEYNFTYRAAEHGDFIEGIKATIIDRNHTPNWRFASMEDVGQADIDKMLAPFNEASF